MSCLIGRLRCWLAAPLPLPQTWTCCAVQIVTRVPLSLYLGPRLVNVVSLRKRPNSLYLQHKLSPYPDALQHLFLFGRGFTIGQAAQRAPPKTTSFSTTARGRQLSDHSAFASSACPHGLRGFLWAGRQELRHHARKPRRGTILKSGIMRGHRLSDLHLHFSRSDASPWNYGRR